MKRVYTCPECGGTKTIVQPVHMDKTTFEDQLPPWIPCIRHKYPTYNIPAIKMEF